MTNFLIKIFVKNNEDRQNQKVRQHYGMLGGFVGVCCNIVLFTIKFFAGIMTGAISITADAFNNLSDAASSVVTIIGFKMAGMPADDKHPFGHGRVEYISGLVVSMAIILMGFELAKTSVEKILNPTEVSFDILPAVILLISITVKLWMGAFNKKIGVLINSATMKATSMDSLSDVLATSVVLLGMVFTKFAGVNIDGYAGIIVASFICYTGIATAKDTLNPLLGQAPEKEFVEEITEFVHTYEPVVGIHDLIVHNYGPGRLIISLHAEVPCHIDILEIHDVIDNIERDLNEKYDCEAVIHMDPIVTDDKVSNDMKEKVCKIVSEIDDVLRIHDFRMVKGPTHTNLIFDVVVPHKFRLTDNEIFEAINADIKGINETYQAVINIDKAYI